MAQDDYYYEIQLTNKQLVFYFMAGATGLILSFLAGVMVGRGVDAPGGDVQAARMIQEDRIVPEDSARPSAPPRAEDLTYAQRLEGQSVDDTLERPKPSADRGAAASRAGATPERSAPPSRPASSKASAPPPATKASEHPAPGATKTPAKTPEPAPARATSATRAGAPVAGTFSVQVGAFKDRASADSVVARLKQKGFAAFVASPDGADGLYNVRVGSYPARADAEGVQQKLRDEEKFKPFIVKN